MDDNILPNDDINKLFNEKFGELTRSSLRRRLKKELELLDKEKIRYTLSFDPIYTTPFQGNIILQIICLYQLPNDGFTYRFYILIPSAYPFEAPILKMDRYSLEERQYRVQDGLENTSIFHLHSYISDFINSATTKEDLICVKEFIETTNKNPSQQQDILNYYIRHSKYFHPTVTLSQSYRLMCDGLHLALGI